MSKFKDGQKVRKEVAGCCAWVGTIGIYSSKNNKIEYSQDGRKYLCSKLSEWKAIEDVKDELTQAIETVRKAGHTVILKKNWYITGQGEVYEMHDSDKSKKRREFLGSYSTKEEAERIAQEIKSKYGQ